MQQSFKFTWKGGGTSYCFNGIRPELNTLNKGNQKKSKKKEKSLAITVSAKSIDTKHVNIWRNKSAKGRLSIWDD